MLIWPECLPCILRMSIDTARLALGDDGRVKAFGRAVLRHPAFRDGKWDITSPEIVAVAWRRLIRLAHDTDPLAGIKAEQNTKALAAQGAAEAAIAAGADPFVTALRLAIAGNAMDAMVGVTKSDGPQDAPDALPAVHGAEGLKGRIARAGRIVYLLDNCGEVVFDRLFLAVIKRAYGKEATVVARGAPILNDATCAEAKAVGLDEVAPVVGNGIRYGYPGTRLHLVSARVRRLLLSADLIVSKGVGNLDSLTEERELRGRISFLFHGKCGPCCWPRGVPIGDLVVDNA